MSTPTATRREWGTGGISWVTPTKIRLRVWAPTEDGGRRRRTKVVRGVPDRDRGGRGVAKVALEQFMAEVAQPAVPELPRSTVTVSEMLKGYLAHCTRIGRTQSTVESYENATKRVTPELGAMPLAKLTGTDLNALYGELAATLGPNTIRHTHAVITAALDQALKAAQIVSNPGKAATAPLRHKPKRKALPLYWSSSRRRRTRKHPYATRNGVAHWIPDSVSAGTRA
jgi:hypothetical protein